MKTWIRRIVTAGTLTWALVLAVPLVGQTASQADAVAIGDWHYVDARDPMTDARRDFAWTSDDDSEVLFGLKCFDDGPSVLLAVMDAGTKMSLLGIDGTPSFRWRIGDGEPERGYDWSYDDDKYAWMKDAAPSEVEAIRNAGKVAARIFGPDGDHVGTYVFSLTGSARALGQLSCVGDVT